MCERKRGKNEGEGERVKQNVKSDRVRISHVTFGENISTLETEECAIGGGNARTQNMTAEKKIRVSSVPSFWCIEIMCINLFVMFVPCIVAHIFSRGSKNMRILSQPPPFYPFYGAVKRYSEHISYESVLACKTKGKINIQIVHRSRSLPSHPG